MLVFKILFRKIFEKKPSKSLGSGEDPSKSLGSEEDFFENFFLNKKNLSRKKKNLKPHPMRLDLRH